MTLAEKKAELSAVLAGQAAINQLPTPGAKAWMQQYIAALQEDVAAEQSAAADQVRDSSGTAGIDWRPILQTVGEVAWSAVKKHWPTASISAVLSALVSYATNFLLK